MKDVRLILYYRCRFKKPRSTGDDLLVPQRLRAAWASLRAMSQQLISSDTPL
jgi:hypothetical protein